MQHKQEHEREWVVEESVVITAPPEQVYGAIANLRRMGEWSPETFSVWIRSGGGSRNGAVPEGTVPAGTRFVGWNRIRWRLWFTTCRVTAAEPSRVFAFRVTSFGVPVAVWGYRMEDIGEGSTRVTEYWEDLRRGGLGSRIISMVGWVASGSDAAADRAAHNRVGMRATLNRLKAALES